MNPILTQQWERVGPYFDLYVKDDGQYVCQISASLRDHREAVAKAVVELPNLIRVLQEWLSMAEAGFLDEIPRFKPDVYQNQLVADTVAVLERIGV